MTDADIPPLNSRLKQVDYSEGAMQALCFETDDGERWRIEADGGELHIVDPYSDERRGA